MMKRMADKYPWYIIGIKEKMTDSIKVAVRVRPFNDKEREEGSRNIVEMDGQTVRLKHPETGEQKAFGFHRCYWSVDDSLGRPPVDNEFVFKDIGQEILQHIYQGYNSTVFAYGQTGSGKSYSIEGYAEKGILQMCLEDIFKRKRPQNDAKGLITTVRVSYLEIYNEKLRDLVNPRENTEIKVMQAGTAVFIQGVDPRLCESYEEVEKIFKDGKKIRVIGAHAMNKNSSRSHAVFIIEYKEVGKGKVIEAKFNIVDLAGSERQSKTFATGVRLEEANNINKSLTNLGIVIEQLAKNADKKTKEHVPYRNSLLTHILSQSLCGNSKTFMIAAISPAHTNYEESLGTLRFAQRASLIKTNSKKNMEAKEGYNKELMEEIERLKRELESAKGKEVHTHSVQMEYITIEEQQRSAELIARLEMFQRELEKSKADKETLENNLIEERRRKEEMDKLREEMLNNAGMNKGGLDQKLPYIMNISEDPTLAGMLTYNIKAGQTTIGTKDGDNNINLNALGIQMRHCSLFNEKGSIYVEPKPEAKVLVNGIVTTQRRRLQHLDRISIGHGNTFKLVIPGNAMKDDLRQSMSFAGLYGQFLDDRLNADTPQAKNTKQFLDELAHRLDKALFRKFLEKFKGCFEDIEQANGYTFERYKKFPLRSKNLRFKINVLMNIENYMKEVPELVIMCEHKEDNEVLFIWTEDKFQKRLSEMQSWWTTTKGKSAENTFYEFDPWFDATDVFIQEKQKVENMKNKELSDYWEQKLARTVEVQRETLKEQNNILNKLKQNGYSQELTQQYADFYFRGFQAKEKNKSKIENMRKQDNTHKLIQRFMQCCAQVQKCKLDHKHELLQRERYTNGAKKGKNSSKNEQEIKEMMELYRTVEELKEQLRKRAKEKKAQNRA